MRERKRHQIEEWSVKLNSFNSTLSLRAGIPFLLLPTHSSLSL